LFPFCPANKKSDYPKLKDEVHRLKGISGKGCRTKWLKDNQINTVEEFVKALNKDEEKIRNVRPLGFQFSLICARIKSLQKFCVYVN
jgi:hypothetical protein